MAGRRDNRPGADSDDEEGPDNGRRRRGPGRPPGQKPWWSSLFPFAASNNTNQRRRSQELLQGASAAPVMLDRNPGVGGGASLDPSRAGSASADYGTPVSAAAATPSTVQSSTPGYTRLGPGPGRPDNLSRSTPTSTEHSDLAVVAATAGAAGVAGATMMNRNNSASTNRSVHTPTNDQSDSATSSTVSPRAHGQGSGETDEFSIPGSANSASGGALRSYYRPPRRLNGNSNGSDNGTSNKSIGQSPHMAIANTSHKFGSPNTAGLASGGGLGAAHPGNDPSGGIAMSTSGSGTTPASQSEFLDDSYRAPPGEFSQLPHAYDYSLSGPDASSLGAAGLAAAGLGAAAYHHGHGNSNGYGLGGDQELERQLYNNNTYGNEPDTIPRRTPDSFDESSPLTVQNPTIEPTLDPGYSSPGGSGLDFASRPSGTSGSDPGSNPRPPEVGYNEEFARPETGTVIGTSGAPPMKSSAAGLALSGTNPPHLPLKSMAHQYGPDMDTSSQFPLGYYHSVPEETGSNVASASASAIRLGDGSSANINPVVAAHVPGLDNREVHSNDVPSHNPASQPHESFSRGLGNTDDQHFLHPAADLEIQAAAVAAGTGRVPLPGSATGSLSSRGSGVASSRSSVESFNAISGSESSGSESASSPTTGLLKRLHNRSGSLKKKLAPGTGDVPGAAVLSGSPSRPKSSNFSPSSMKWYDNATSSFNPDEAAIQAAVPPLDSGDQPVPGDDDTTTRSNVVAPTRTNDESDQTMVSNHTRSTDEDSTLTGTLPQIPAVESSTPSLPGTAITTDDIRPTFSTGPEAADLDFAPSQPFSDPVNPEFAGAAALGGAAATEAVFHHQNHVNTTNSDIASTRPGPSPSSSYHSRSNSSSNRGRGAPSTPPANTEPISSRSGGLSHSSSLYDLNGGDNNANSSSFSIGEIPPSVTLLGVEDPQYDTAGSYYTGDDNMAGVHNVTLDPGYNNSTIINTTAPPSSSSRGPLGIMAEGIQPQYYDSGALGDLEAPPPIPGARELRGRPRVSSTGSAGSSTTSNGASDEWSLHTTPEQQQYEIFRTPPSFAYDAEHDIEMANYSPITPLSTSGSIPESPSGGIGGVLGVGREDWHGSDGSGHERRGSGFGSMSSAGSGNGAQGSSSSPTTRSTLRRSSADASSGSKSPLNNSYNGHGHATADDASDESPPVLKSTTSRSPNVVERQTPADPIKPYGGSSTAVLNQTAYQVQQHNTLPTSPTPKRGLSQASSPRYPAYSPSSSFYGLDAGATTSVTSALSGVSRAGGMNRVASGPGSSTGTISVPVAPMSGPASPAVGYGNPASSPFMDVGAKHVPLRQPVPSSVSPTPWQATIHHIGDIDNDDDDQKSERSGNDSSNRYSSSSSNYDTASTHSIEDAGASFDEPSSLPFISSIQQPQPVQSITPSSSGRRLISQLAPSPTSPAAVQPHHHYARNHRHYQTHNNNNNNSSISNSGNFERENFHQQ